MNTLRDAIQLALTTSLSNREIAEQVDIAYNTVGRYRRLAKEKQWDTAELLALSDEDLVARFTSRPPRWTGRNPLDFEYIHREMQRKHVTLQLLWLEYRENEPNGYGYSQYTHLYREWARKNKVVMRQQHQPGERGWVDFAGPTIPWLADETGEVHEAQVFVASVGVSDYLFAYAVPSQETEQWIAAHAAWYEALGGVPAITTSDNLKAAVLQTGPEPKLNPNYVEMARHYGTVILPTRPAKPRDKARAEGGVLLVERWAIAKLRNRTFQSIAEINVALVENMVTLNAREMRQYRASRIERFEELDKPALRPLPAERFEYADWHGPIRVRQDYHVSLDRHFYSVPHRLVSEEVTLRVTASMVEIFHKRERVASHERSRVEGGTTTDKAHQPDNHRAWGEQTPERYRSWASGIGPNALELINAQFEGRHPALAMRACSSLHGLAKTHGTQRFEDACREALRIKSPVCKSVRSILQNRLERRGQEATDTTSALPAHSNVRGPDYYAKEAVNAD